MSKNNHLRVGSHGTSFKSHVKSLGVDIDTMLSMVKRTDHIHRSVYLEVRRISSIRHLLAIKATAQLMCSIVLSYLDYCKSLLIDITSDQAYHIQEIQNHAAEVVFRKTRDQHIKPLFEKLHWLPVRERTLFKKTTFAFRFSYGILPPHLSSCLSVYTLSPLSVPVLMKISFLCKMETQSPWSPAVLWSGALCLELPSSPHPTQQFSPSVQNFS